MKDKSYSSDGENYYNNMSTVIDDALFDLVGTDKDEKPNPFEVGMEVIIFEGDSVRNSISDFSPPVDYLLDYIMEGAYEAAGEWADGYLDDAKKEDLEVLGDMINGVLDSWANKHGLHPHFFTVENSIPLTIRITDLKGGYEIVNE